MTVPLNHPQQPLRQSIKDFSCFQRLLLTTDGTVTEMLEQYLGEQIKVQKLSENIEHNPLYTFPRHLNQLDQQRHPVLVREILLQGQSTLKNWVHAESTIIPDNLPRDFRNDLMASREPIGRLWEKHRVETFKQVVDFAQFPADTLAHHFAIDRSTLLISRTYRVFSAGKLIMIITENFPSTYFLD